MTAPDCPRRVTPLAPEPHESKEKTSKAHQESKFTSSSFCSFCGLENHNAFSCPRRRHARNSLAASMLLLAKAHFYDPALSYDSFLQDVIHTDAFLSLSPAPIIGPTWSTSRPRVSWRKQPICRLIPFRASHRCRGT
jgi:hypothetical protein